MLKKIMIIAGLVLGCGLSVWADAPIDMTATGTAIAGYVADAAAAGLAIFAGLFGIRVIVRAFASVAG